MARTDAAKVAPAGLRLWLMKDMGLESRAKVGPHSTPNQVHKTHKWWQICA